MVTKSTIKKKDRKEMGEDPSYRVCMLYGHNGHICGGRITFEHTLVTAGKSLQAKWAIISLCARGHSVDEYQDNHELNKELNEWVAYSRATEDDLLNLCGDIPGTDPALAKSRLHFKRKAFLIGKYGLWEQKIDYGILDRKKNTIENTLMNQILDNRAKSNFPPLFDEAKLDKPKKDWFRVMPADMKLIEDIQAYIKSQDDYHMPYPDVIRNAIKKMHEAVMELKSNVQM